MCKGGMNSFDSLLNCIKSLRKKTEIDQFEIELREFSDEYCAYVAHEMPQEEEFWTILKDFLFDSPHEESQFFQDNFREDPAILAVRNMIYLLLDCKKKKILVPTRVEDYLFNVLSNREYCVATEMFHAYCKNIELFELLSQRKIAVINSKLQIYNSMYCGSENCFSEIDNTKLLMEPVASNLRDCNFDYSFYFFPREVLIQEKYDLQTLKIILHMYFLREDISEARAYIIETSKTLNQVDIIDCIIDALLANNVSFQQVSIFTSRVFSNFDNTLIGQSLASKNSESILVYYLKSKFCNYSGEIRYRLAELSQCEVEMLFQVYVNRKELKSITPELLDRLVASEELDYDIMQLGKIGYQIFIDQYTQLNPQSCFFYISLLKDINLAFVTAKNLLWYDCFALYEVGIRLINVLPINYEQQLLQYYISNFEAKTDTHNKWIDISRLIYELSRNTHSALLFLNVPLNEDPEQYVLNFFSERSVNGILQAAFLLEYYQTYEEYMALPASYAMFITSGIYSREINAQNDGQELPLLQQKHYDPDDLNTYLSFTIIPEEFNMKTSNELAITNCLYFLRSLLLLADIEQRLTDMLYCYLTTVQIVPTVKYFLKYIKQPSRKFKEVFLSQIKQAHFSDRRNSAAIRFICEKIFTKEERYELYDKDELEFVHLNFGSVPLGDIFERIDGQFLQKAAFSAAFASILQVKEGMYSIAEECSEININCQKTGLICKLIYLKHVRVTSQQRKEITGFLLRVQEMQIGTWSDNKIRTLCCQALANELNFSEFHGVKSQMNDEWRECFCNTLKEMFGEDVSK